MGIEMKYVTSFVVLAFVLLVRGTDAATYVVGDSLGWTIPSGGVAAYTSWAAKQTYAPGDVLVFNFAAGVHDVATVTKAAYDSCSSTSPLSLQTISPANFSLTTAGTYYFICTFGQHCSLGQKLTLTVTSSTAPPTAAAKPPTTSTKPPSSGTLTPTAATKPPTASAMPPSASTKPPTVATMPPTGTGAPAMPPASATMPPSAAPTPTMTAPTPMAPPAASPEGGAPASGSTTGPSGAPGTANPPGSPAPPGDSATPPSPGSASRKAAATLAVGFVLVVMGVVF